MASGLRESNDPVRWGVLGAAKIAENYAMPAILEANDSRLCAIGSRRKEAAERLARKFDIEKAYASYQETIDDPAIDAVYIALPNALHAHWTIAALAGGKHVLCEKPMATSVAEIEMVDAASGAAGRLALEAFMYRHHPQFEALTKMIAQGVVGEVRSIRGALSFVLDEPDDIRMSARLGGGALLDLACYIVHASAIIYGCSAHAGAAVSFPTPDGVDLHTAGVLEYPGERVASIEASFRLPWFESRLQVSGEQGDLLLPHAFNPGNSPTQLIHTPVNGSPNVIAFSGVNMYVRMFRAFARTLADDVDNTVYIASSRAVQIGLQLLASATLAAPALVR